MPRISERDYRAVPGALRFYRVCAYITGVMLILLCLEMLLKYPAWNGTTGYELIIGGNAGGIAFLPSETGDGFNVNTAILIAHGWLYVVYLISAFRIWSLMRWPFSRFIAMALGGVVPLMSFFTEARIHRQALTDLKGYEVYA